MSAGLCLMWKEYRVLRGFWIALAIFGLACDGLIMLFVANPQDRLPGLFGLVGLLPACFALGAGATLFALEREESTRELLQYLPLTSWRIFVSKVCVALSGTLLLTLVLLGAGLGGAWFALGHTTGTRLAGESELTYAIYEGATCAVLVLQAMGWSVFFSLKSARPLLAAFLGAVGALSCIGLVHFLASGLRPRQDWIILFAHAAATAAIWLIDIRLGSTWLHGRAIAVSTGQTESTRQTPLTRLFWQEWRRSRRMLAALAALGLIFPLLQWTDPHAGGLGAVPAVGFVLALLGSCTFLGDQERSQFRFFAERGVSGRSVWFSRQSFWIGCAAVLAAILLLLHVFLVPLGVPHLIQSADSAVWARARFALSWFAVDTVTAAPGDHAWTIQWHSGLAGFFVWLSLAFGAGQLCSMFFRSGLLAAVFGVMLAGVLLGWAALMQVLSIGWWWSVAPLAVALFAATWLRSDGWVLDRRDIRSWLPSVLVLAVPVLALLTAVPVYRVFEIPMAEEFQGRSQPAASAEANGAVGRLFAMYQQLALTRTTDFPTVSDDCPPEERQWLTENQNALDALVEASLHLPADGAAERILSTTATTWHHMATTMIWYGQIAEADGELDEAWTRYHAAIGLARVVGRNSFVLGEVSDAEMERTALSQLIRWGARKGQTVERLRAALSALEQLDAAEGPLTDLIWREYQANLARIDEFRSQPQPDDALYGLAAKWAPWEFTRARRLLRYVASLDMQDAGVADAAFAAGGRLPVVSRVAVDPARVHLLAQTTLLPGRNPIDGIIGTRCWTLCYRRATRLALAAECWRLEHGDMPERLEDLEQIAGASQIDPYTAQPFLWFPRGLRASIRSANVSHIPAKTPLLYGPAGASSAESDLNHLNALRRPGAATPVPNGPGMGSIPPGAEQMTAAPAAGGSPTQGTPAGVGTWLRHVAGLAFPIPNQTGEEDFQ